MWWPLVTWQTISRHLADNLKTHHASFIHHTSSRHPWNTGQKSEGLSLRKNLGMGCHYCSPSFSWDMGGSTPSSTKWNWFKSPNWGVDFVKCFFNQKWYVYFLRGALFYNNWWEFWRVHTFSCPEADDPPDHSQCTYNTDVWINGMEEMCQQWIELREQWIERHSWSIGNCSEQIDIIGFTGNYSFSKIFFDNHSW